MIIRFTFVVAVAAVIVAFCCCCCCCFKKNASKMKWLEPQESIFTHKNELARKRVPSL